MTSGINKLPDAIRNFVNEKELDELPDAIRDFIYEDYPSAHSCIELLKAEQLSEEYSALKGKNCIHWLLDRDSSESQKFLRKIIEKINNKNIFKRAQPFLYTLKEGKLNSFDSLLKHNIGLITDEEIPECLKLCIINKKEKKPTKEIVLFEQCKALIEKLPVEKHHLITEGANSPLIESIEKSCLSIFDLFLPYIHVGKEGQKLHNFFSSPKENGESILCIIARSSRGDAFLRKLWKKTFPKETCGKQNMDRGYYSIELAKLINQKDKDGNTPLSIAVKEKNKKLVNTLIEYGADFKSLKTKDDTIKKIIEDANYGCIKEPDLPPNWSGEKAPTWLDDVRKSKREGLIRCCEEGNIELAKDVIKKYKIDPFITDSNKNSLIMILINHKVDSKKIIEFINFLGEKRINFEHQNNNLDNLLTVCTQQEKIDIAKHLIENHEDKCKEIINNINKTSETALTIAINKGNMELVELLFEKFEETIKRNVQWEKIMYSLIQKINSLSEEKSQISKTKEKAEEIQKDLKKRNESLIQEVISQIEENIELSEIKDIETSDQKLKTLEIQKRLLQEKSKSEGLSKKFEKSKTQSKREIEGLIQEVSSQIEENIEFSETKDIEINDQKLKALEIQKQLSQVKSKSEGLSKKFEEYKIQSKKEEDENLKKIKEVALAWAEQNGKMLKYVPEELRKDKKFVLAAVKQNGLALQYAAEELRKNREIVLAAVKQSGFAFEYAVEELRKDREIVLAAVKQSGFPFQYAAEELRKDGKFVLTAVKQNGRALEYVAEELRKDRKIVLAAVKQDGLALKHATEELRKNSEVVLAAVKQNGFAFEYAAEELRTDRETVLAVVKEKHWVFKFAAEELRKDKKFVLAVVEQSGLALQYAAEELRKNSEVVLVAVKQDWGAFEFAHKDLVKDKQFFLSATT